MGFTHYFDQERAVTETEWEAITKDVEALLAHLATTRELEIVGVSGERGTTPEISSERIAFNGLEEDGFESFVLGREQGGFGFCKTGRRPYDLLVTAALIVAAHHAPGAYTVTSDGQDYEWSPALSFVRGVLGEGYDLPGPVADNEGFAPGYRKAGEPGYDRERTAYFGEGAA